MGFIIGIWAAILRVWIRIGLAIFPSTIHPMVVHFVIAIFYVALFADLVARFARQPDHFWDQSSFWLLVLALIAGVVTAATGVIAEQYVKWTPTTLRLLSLHQTYAVLSGVLAVAALGARLVARYPRAARRGWSLAGSGRGRSTGLSLLLLTATVIMVSMTSSVGGTMVFQYGVGVHHVTFRSPSHG